MALGRVARVTAGAAQLHPFPPIDPSKNQIIMCIGRKGAGKSVNARETFLHWPDTDRLVIDPTGDADPGDDALTLHQVPDSLPSRKDGKPVTVRIIVNPGSPTYAEDMDKGIGLALFPKDRRVLLWVDEAGEAFPSGRTGPNGNTLLKQSRHWNASVILACPRPITVDPLCLSQADRVILYDLPNPADRKRVAGAIGWPPDRLNAALDGLRNEPPHSFLMYVAHEHALYLCPPLPMTSADKKAGS